MMMITLDKSKHSQRRASQTHRQADMLTKLLCLRLIKTSAVGFLCRHQIASQDMPSPYEGAFPENIKS